MNAKNIKKLILILPLAIATACSTTPSSDEHEHHDHHEGEEEHDHEGHDEHLGPDDVHFSDAQAEAIGLRVDTLHADAAFAPIIPCSGIIESQAAGSLTIVAPQAGIVSIIDRQLAPGAYLAKGQTVATISGKAIQEGDAAQKARLEYEAAKKDYDRANELIGDKIISQKEYEETRLRYDNARAAYDALANKMTANGVAVSATAAGHVTRVFVDHGQYVQAGQAIATVERCGSKRLRADVPERHFTALRNIASANIRTSVGDSTYRLANMDGRLVSVGVSVGNGGAYVPVTFDFADDSEQFLAGQAATVYLILKGAKGENTLSVPNDALIESQGLNFVYIRDAEDGDIYHRREVKTGETDGIRTEIVKGLTEGDIAVVAGAHRLHLAGSSKAIPAHTHNH